ncbi:sulfatase [Pedobacter heparinus]|uniref:sulfatase family protein n=1 Tax=Pedobacter heparinus TaxID=984 RepID=UPI00292E1393|nr:sulfatase [Pedobacter heparinus]
MNARLLILSLFCFSAGYAQSGKIDQPNVIIINMDDMGYGDTEPYGMTGIPTPNFNKLAAQGMRFTHFNAAQAVCSPSRAALLTGCYPNRLGLSGALSPVSKTALNTAEETIASLLKKAGYKTAMLGKWHLGSKAPNLPVHYGFDSFYGLPYSHDMWPVDYYGKPEDSVPGKKRYPKLPILDGDKVVAYNNTLDDQAKLTGTFTQKAVGFIEQNKHHPFFLYLAHPMPHVPLAASARFRGKSELGLFGDVIMELDWSVGEIINALDKNKLAAHTILIVMSDNGPWLRFGNHAGSSGGFRGGKMTVWDGGTRVPCIIRWPGKVAAGSVNSELLTNMDILPTLLDITHAPPPKNKIDGLSFEGLLLGKSDKDPRQVFYYYYNANSLKAVRYKHWKLVLSHQSVSYTSDMHGKDGLPGAATRLEVKMGLYDLAHDPGEAYDVQLQYPEIVKKILVLAEDARTDLGDDLTGRKGKNLREPARVN